MHHFIIYRNSLGRIKWKQIHTISGKNIMSSCGYQRCAQIAGWLTLYVYSCQDHDLRYFQRHISRKWYKMYLQWKINRKPYLIYEWCRFQLPRITPNPNVKGTPLFDVGYLRNGIKQRHHYNKILIGSYALKGSSALEACLRRCAI